MWFGATRGPYGTPDHGTREVAMLLPNQFGLHDVSGNVWEWCQDWYGGYSAGAATDPVGPASGAFRVLRGGCWDNHARSCRSAHRRGSNPDGRGSDVGVRLAWIPLGHLAADPAWMLYSALSD